ncbi:MULTISPECIES: hypothetical protein [unclassified Streptomyces]|uniref:hypothetical protein n=1 Tax=unclassified Streptomyces TaxID=2593676 RepID=UPI00037F9269|nr:MULTISPECIES: hypothetical protein [unclassified Streptomyces]MYX37055.1 hypothetical protein [Streptomyces sp. SID8377]
MHRVLWTVLAFALTVLAVSGLAGVIYGAVGGGDVPSMLFNLAMSSALFITARGARRRVIENQ